MQYLTFASDEYKMYTFKLEQFNSFNKLRFYVIKLSDNVFTYITV